MSKHTFLLSEGYWKATGKYWDEQHNEYPVNGETIIKHLESKWINKGVMRVYADRSINFSNEYEIEPLQPGKQKTKWISHSAAMGHMHGTFKISDDQLVSEYKSAKNNYRGCERFTYQNDDQYKVEGELIKGGKTVSTWSVVLQRQRSAVSGSKH